MPRTIFCAGCGKELLSHLVICPVCATPLPATGPEPQPYQEPPRPPQGRPTEAPPQDFQSPYGWMGANETPKPVTRLPVPEDYQPPQPGAPSTLPCPSCGKAVLRTNAFCPQCGRPLTAMQASPYQPPLPPEQPVHYPVVQTPSGRTSGEYALITIIAILAALIILANFC